MKSLVYSILGIIIIAGGVYAYQRYHQAGVSHQDPSVAAQAMIATAQDLELEGLSEEEAAQVAADNNVLFRVVERDGEPLAMTMDYRPGRINATVEAGVVTDYTIEGADSQ